MRHFLYNSRIFLTLLFIIVTMISTIFAEEQGTIRFSDIPEDHPMKEDIDSLVKAGIVFGFQDGTFRPKEEATKALLVVALMNALGIASDDKFEGLFSDISKDYWAAKIVETATRKGFITNDGKPFKPEQKITEKDTYRIIKEFTPIGRVRGVASDILTRERLVYYLAKLDVVAKKREVKRQVNVIAKFGDKRDVDLRAAIFYRNAVNKFIEGNILGAKEDVEYAKTLKAQDKDILELYRLIAGDSAVAQVETVKVEYSASKDLVTKKLNEALYHFYNGRFNEALSGCEDVLKLEPDNTVALMRKGSAYYMLKEYQSAKNTWERVLQLDPNNKEAKAFVAEIAKRYNL